MNEINYLDVAVIALSVILGVKGIINGLVKELFGLIGIIGGAYVASRLSTQVGKWVDASVYQLENTAAINLVGFVVTLACVWLIAILLGNLIAKAVKLSGLGPLDRLFGFVFGAGKVFLIFSIILYALSNVTFIAKKAEAYTENSLVYPLMLEVGHTIIKIDPDTLTPDFGGAVGDIDIGGEPDTGAPDAAGNTPAAESNTTAAPGAES